MTDVLVVVGLIAAFALLAAFVVVCARIIGPDPEGVRLSTGADDLVGEEDELLDSPTDHASYQEVTA
ncbi:MAG: hypothetical protein U0W40_19340 [Acidimicrobiia bacterium]